VAIKALLARELSEADRLGHVATVALHEVKLQIQPTQPNHAYDVVEADGVAARFQTRDGGLMEASPASQLGLRQTGALAGFTDQLCTIRRHELI
jgi:hypothetical protein